MRAPASPQRSTGRVRQRTLKLALLATALGAALWLLGLLGWPLLQRHALPATAAAAGKAAEAAAAAAASAGAAAGLEERLLARAAHDLRPFERCPPLCGISRRMVEQAYCQGSRGSMRVQVINGSVYIAGESPSYESRLLGLKRQLLRLWLAGRLPEGIDFVIEQEDAPTARPPSLDCPTPGPLLAPAKQPANASHAHVLLAPDHSFAGWPEARTLAWAEMLPLLQHAAKAHPWERRAGRLFFRGAVTGERNLTDPELSETYPELLDVQLVNWTSPDEQHRFVSLADHCSHKLLLHLPGNTYAARLKYLLACGSAVVAPESPWVEFWSPLLQPGQHLVYVEPIDEANRGHHLADAAADLQQDDPLARRLGAAGAALVARALAPPMVEAYWQRLLEGYRRLQNFNATLHPDAVPLERSVLVPQLVNVTRRTCPVCAPTREQLLEQRRLDLGLTEDDPLPQLALPVWQAAEGQRAAAGVAGTE